MIYSQVGAQASTDYTKNMLSNVLSKIWNPGHSDEQTDIPKCGKGSSDGEGNPVSCFEDKFSDEPTKNLKDGWEFVTYDEHKQFYSKNGKDATDRLWRRTKVEGERRLVTVTSEKPIESLSIKGAKEPSGTRDAVVGAVFAFVSPMYKGESAETSAKKIIESSIT